MYRTVPIGSIADINPRMPKSLRSNLDMAISFLQMASVHEDGTFGTPEIRKISDVINGYSYFEQGDILLAKITPSFENAKATYLAELPNKVGFGSTEFHVIRPKEGIDGRYLFYMIWNKIFRFYGSKSMTGAAGQRRIPTSFVRDFEIPLPSLPEEQKRIADILDKANSVRRKRQQVIGMADSFLRSVFLDMFGDPVANPRGWKNPCLGDIACDVRYGTSVKCIDLPSEEMLPVLRIPNIVNGSINYNELKYAKLNDKEINRLILQRHDLLFVRTNGNPEYIARCAVFNGDEKALFASYLIRVRLKKKFITIAEFIKETLSLSSYRALITRETKTTAGNYNINSQGLKSLHVIMPDYELIERFLKISKFIKTNLKKFNEQLNHSNAMYNGIVNRIFQENI